MSAWRRQRLRADQNGVSQESSLWSLDIGVRMLKQVISLHPPRPRALFLPNPPTDCCAIVSPGRAPPEQGRKECLDEGSTQRLLKMGRRKAAGSSNTEAYIVPYVEVDERRERSEEPFSAAD